MRAVGSRSRAPGGPLRPGARAGPMPSAPPASPPQVFTCSRNADELNQAIAKWTEMGYKVQVRRPGWQALQGGGGVAQARARAPLPALSPCALLLHARRARPPTCPSQSPGRS
jgi:hypothetical protein